MHFKDLIGQKDFINQLLAMWHNQRMPHALLLLGPEGCGKLTAALALAQFILCENSSSNESCGQCRSCLKLSKWQHPDLHFVFPTVGSKATSDQYIAQWRAVLSENPYLNANDWLQYIGAENKQGNITKEECLAIIKKLSLKTFEGKAKIMIIWLPEYLAKEGNRLLKIIEEPPQDTYYILVAQNAELILNTILSRCQIMKVKAPDDQEIITALSQQFKDIEDEQLKRIAYLADGNYNEAQKLASTKENDNAQMLLDWLRKAYKANGVQMATWSEAFAKLGRENQKQFFQYALFFIREFLQQKINPAARVRLGANELKTAQNLTNVLGIDQVGEMMDLFQDAAYHIERNGNPKIIMLDASIQLSKIIKRPKAKAKGSNLVNNRT